MLFRITLCGLVGPNGSGKTTAINVISRLYAPDGGSVSFDGQAIGNFAAQGRVYLGINRTLQVPKPLTVRQNIAVPLAYGRAKAAPPTPEASMDEYRLTEVADRPASALNNAQQKMLDQVRAGDATAAAVGAQQQHRLGTAHVGRDSRL